MMDSQGGEKVLKTNCRKIRVVALGILMLMLLSISFSTTQAAKAKNVKVNGALFNPFFYFDSPYAKPREGDTLMLEVKATLVDDTLIGSGSAHGINCHATFFFSDLTGYVSGNTIYLSGTIGGTTPTTPYKELWQGQIVQITADLSTSEVHFIMPAFELDFEGLGTVVQ